MSKRDLLAQTIWRVKEGRYLMLEDATEEGPVPEWVRKRHQGSAHGLRCLSMFVRSLNEDDLDLRLLRHLDPHPKDSSILFLHSETLHMLRRFWADKGARQGQAEPTEAQMRNILRRMDGAEQRWRRDQAEQRQ
jgi:hypothetical protein